jgi:hypothetical protein
LNDTQRWVANSYSSSGRGFAIFRWRDAASFARVDFACVDEVSMSTAEYSRKLDELDRLLNDPDVPMQPDRIWSLLADVSRPETASTAHPAMGRPAE